MKITIGRIDKADFPEFQLREIDVKVDSGAYTSSIHCANIEETSDKGTPFIKFTLLDEEHPFYNQKEFSTKNFTKKFVKSSNGLAEERFVIRTKIFIFNETFDISLTLSQRSEMKYPILLGRKFLNKKFIIDTSKKNISHKLNQ